MGILLELLRKKLVFVIYLIVGTTKLKACQGTQTLLESKEGGVARERKGKFSVPNTVWDIYTKTNPFTLKRLTFS